MTFMSTTFEEVLREARKLAPDERRELVERLLEESPRSTTGGEGAHGQTESGLSLNVRQQRLEWLKSHRAEYGGQHVALDGAALVALGQSYREAKEKALSAGKPGAFITYLPKPDEVAEWGGW
jgi:hypothetical protein